MKSSTEERTEDWGLTDYDEAFERQKALVERRIAGEVGDTLVFTEHQPVYTLGKRQGAESHLVWEASERESAGITLSKTNRGGDVTYHGPAQIVGYPIISLEKTKDLHAYLRGLEQVLIHALGSLGLSAERREGKTGIWLKDRKIAAMGVAVRRWVTYHGFALNVNNDLSPFDGIVPCGIAATEGSVTSMKKELRSEQDLSEVKGIIAVEFWRIFSK